MWLYLWNAAPPECACSNNGDRPTTLNGDCPSADGQCAARSRRQRRLNSAQVDDRLTPEEDVRDGGGDAGSSTSACSLFCLVFWAALQLGLDPTPCGPDTTRVALRLGQRVACAKAGKLADTGLQPLRGDLTDNLVDYRSRWGLRSRVGGDRPARLDQYQYRQPLSPAQSDHAHEIGPVRHSSVITARMLPRACRDRHTTRSTTPRRA